MKQKDLLSAAIFPDKEGAVYDIGYCIHKEYWRQGYGTEAVLLLMDWVHRHGGREITAEVAQENFASNLLLKKLGFEIKKESEFQKYKMKICYKSYIYRFALR